MAKITSKEKIKTTANSSKDLEKSDKKRRLSSISREGDKNPLPVDETPLLFNDLTNMSKEEITHECYRMQQNYQLLRVEYDTTYDLSNRYRHTIEMLRGEHELQSRRYLKEIAELRAKLDEKTKKNEELKNQLKETQSEKRVLQGQLAVYDKMKPLLPQQHKQSEDFPLPKKSEKMRRDSYSYLPQKDHSFNEFPSTADRSRRESFGHRDDSFTSNGSESHSIKAFHLPGKCFA